MKGKNELRKEVQLSISGCCKKKHQGTHHMNPGELSLDLRWITDPSESFDDTESKEWIRPLCHESGLRDRNDTTNVVWDENFEECVLGRVPFAGIYGHWHLRRSSVDKGPCVTSTQRKMSNYIEPSRRHPHLSTKTLTKYPNREYDLESDSTRSLRTQTVRPSETSCQANRLQVKRLVKI